MGGTSPKLSSRNPNFESGMAAVELALVLPILLIVVFAIINFAALMYDYIVITNAAREGARWGSIHTNEGFNCSTDATGNSDPCQVANSYASMQMINFGSSASTSTQASGDGTAGSMVTVTVTYSYTGVGWFLSPFFQNIRATSQMYHE
jgi:Flp pilus assembly protein TadG